jgi:simple sugar transport system permease protein
VSWLLKYLRSSEGIILLTTILLCVGVASLNPVFLSAANLLDLVRNSITTGLFALGVYVALLSGGIDVSFTAVAAVAMYGTVKLSVLINPHAPLWLLFVVSALIGALLGAVNATLIALFRLPTLIVTLGTLSLFRGFLLTFLGTKHITDIPDSMLQLSRTYLYRGHLADGSSVCRRDPDRSSGSIYHAWAIHLCNRWQRTREHAARDPGREGEILCVCPNRVDRWDYRDRP